MEKRLQGLGSRLNRDMFSGHLSRIDPGAGFLRGNLERHIARERQIPEKTAVAEPDQVRAAG
jgi:hypothetical protein